MLNIKNISKNINSLNYTFSVLNDKFVNKFTFSNLIINKALIYKNYINKNYINNLVVLLNNLSNNIFKINFSISSINKFLNINVSDISINFLRKNKIFNKGRYSRNRQYYRTGVYWCLYINIIAVIGMYFWFYRINMNFTYLWWFFYLCVISIFLPKIINNNIVSYNNFFKTFYNLFIWIYYILVDIYNKLCTLLKLFK